MMYAPRLPQDVVLVLVAEAKATAEVAIVFNLLFLFSLGDDVAVSMLPPEDGVVYWRHH
jgi:hypothetical protein